MFQIQINKSEVRRRAYLFTAAKSRFVGKEKTNQELYTLDLEDSDKESVAQLKSSVANIVISSQNIPNTVASNVLNITVTAGSYSNGNLTFMLHDTSIVVPLTPVDGESLEDQPILTAGQIRAFDFPGWTASGSGAEVILTEDSPVQVFSSVPTFLFDSGMEASVTATVVSTPKTIKSVKLSFPTSDIKADIIALTRQKGRNVTDKNGVSMMDRIAFSAGESLSHTIPTSSANIFALAKHLTARKAKIIAEKNGDQNFSSLVMTGDDSALFDSYYERAFSDMVADLAVLVSSFEKGVSFTITAGFPGSVAGSIESNTEQYLLSHVLGQFYSMCGLTEEAKACKLDAIGYVVTVKNLLSAQADSASLLKNILSDAAIKVQTALYPLSRKAYGGLAMFTYGETSDQAAVVDYLFTDADTTAGNLIFTLNGQTFIVPVIAGGWEANEASIKAFAFTGWGVSSITSGFRLTRNTTGEISLPLGVEVGDTGFGITITPVNPGSYSDSLEFSFELKEIPISSSAIQLIYNICRSVLLNGSLARWYTMAGIADDKNEAKTELESSLSILSYIIEDRLKFTGLFDQLFSEGAVKVRELLTVFTKSMTIADYTLVDELATFKFENKDWEDNAEKSVNFLSMLVERTVEVIYRNILKEWFRLSENKEFEAEYANLVQAEKDLRNAALRTHVPVTRLASWM